MLDFLRDMLVLFWEIIPVFFAKKTDSLPQDPEHAEAIDQKPAVATFENCDPRRRLGPMQCPYCGKALKFSDVRDKKCPNCQVGISIRGSYSMVVKSVMVVLSLSILVAAIMTANFGIVVLAFPLCYLAQVMVALVSFWLFPPELEVGEGSFTLLNLK